MTADTRTRLIVTAMQLFWEQGYGSTSVANVLQAARVNSGSARYRRSLADTDCFYACPIGSLALELHEPDQPVRERLAANFAAWTDAIHQCLKDAGSRLPRDLDRRELAAFVLTAMEGGVVQARTFRDIGSFDGAVRQLRAYFETLLREAPARRAPRARTMHKKKERP